MKKKTSFRGKYGVTLKTIRSMYEDDLMPYRSIGEELGLSVTTVRVAAIKAGVRQRPPGRVTGAWVGGKRVGTTSAFATRPKAKKEAFGRPAEAAKPRKEAKPKQAPKTKPVGVTTEESMAAATAVIRLALEQRGNAKQKEDALSSISTALGYMVLGKGREYDYARELALDISRDMACTTNDAGELIGMAMEIIDSVVVIDSKRAPLRRCDISSLLRCVSELIEKAKIDD